MSDLPKVPIVRLPGSETWESGYLWGEALEAEFPDQDAYDFAAGCRENDMGPAAEKRIISLVMLKQGERDEGDWKWRVVFEDGSAWFAEGGCDYTGWDCQSDLRWRQDDTGLPDLVRQALAADSVRASDENGAVES